MAGKGSSYGTVGGMATGAVIGGAVGGPTGAAVGASLGGSAGGAIGGMFDSEAGSTYSKSDFNALFDQRQNQISRFEEALAGARARYVGNLYNLQNLTFSRFAGQAQAQFANQGLNINGGAFQSALARRATDLTAEGLLGESEMERADLGTVQAARGGLYDKAFGMVGGQFQQPQAGYGQALGALGSQGLSELFAQRRQSQDQAFLREIYGTGQFIKPDPTLYHNLSGN